MSRPQPWDAATRIRQQQLARMVATSVTRCGPVTPPPTRETGMILPSLNGRMELVADDKFPFDLSLQIDGEFVIEHRRMAWSTSHRTIADVMDGAGMRGMSGKNRAEAVAANKWQVEFLTRLAACWNACRDLPDPSVVPELIAACRKIVESSVLSDPGTGLAIYHDAVDAAVAVLAKIEQK